MTEQNKARNADVPLPDAILMQMLFGAVIEQCICVVAKLGIADLLAEKPKTAIELASETKTHEPSFYRVLRTLAGAGIFAETADRKFELTPIAALLRSDAPDSMRDFTIMFGEGWMWRAWGELMHSAHVGCQLTGLVKAQHNKSSSRRE